MQIAYIGKFDRIYDEEYIARSFEMIGCEVIRIPSHYQPRAVVQILEKEKVDFLLYGKLSYSVDTIPFLNKIKEINVKTVCWLFDLYIGYPREHQLKTNPIFKSDYVASTDGGHDDRFKELGVNHTCIRQGIFKDECILYPFKKAEYDIVFVGSDNGAFPQRKEFMISLDAFYNFKWFGKRDTHEIRSLELNELYSKSKIVVGDSFYSPHYWSNRVVETLGRGGFLIHQDVEGLKEAYPHIVTYERGNFRDLRSKIDYYLAHEDERREIIKKNFEWVRNNYTMDRKCNELIQWVNQSTS